MNLDPNDDPGLWAPVTTATEDDPTRSERHDLLVAEAATKALRSKREWLQGVIAGAREHGEKFVGAAASTALARLEVELERAFDLENTARAVLNVAVHQAHKNAERKP